MSGRRLAVAALVTLALATALAGGAWRLVRRPPPAPPTLDLRDVLGGSTEGFARALAPRPLGFPADHGPHPDFRTEWWYYTGNLAAADGRHFGFQLTFFRSATAGAAVARASAWAGRDVYMAHFAVTDTAGRRFLVDSRLSRGAVGLAGAQVRPFKVWVEDWSAEGVGDDPLPVRLRASGPETWIDLTLGAGKPPVLNGDGGFSRKGREPGNASYYYSLTRMPAAGRVWTGGRAFVVAGTAWMDREWGTSPLDPDVAGWDWFALQLDDGRELMIYVLRGPDAITGRFDAGTLVEADGASTRLGPGDFAIEVLDTWTSPRGGTRYPARWRLRVPRAGLELEVTPRLADQELPVAVRYWEGAVNARGVAGSRPVGGVGYVELVGYARDTPMPRRAIIAE